MDLDGYQNYGPLLDPLNNRCRIILRTQKGTIVLTTIHFIGFQIAIVPVFHADLYP